MINTTQYDRENSTLRRICTVLEEKGPMTLYELAAELNMTYNGVRSRAEQAFADGYLKMKKFKNVEGCGRMMSQYSRTALPLPRVKPVSKKTQSRRKLKAKDEEWVREAAVVVVRRDPFIEAFFGKAA